MAHTLFLSLILCCVTPQDSLEGPTEGKLSNQEIALKIATSLRDAKFGGYDITIEVNKGVATLRGEVEDVSHQQQAADITSHIPGVNKTVILLRVAQSTTEPDAQGFASTDQSDESNAGLTNQEMAEKIAGALRTAKLQGSDIEIEYRAGKATLTGSIADTADRKRAAVVVSRIPGVTTVINSLKADQEEKLTAPERTTKPAPDAADRGEDRALAEKLELLSYAVSQNKMGNLTLVRRLMARQQELFESETLHKIEVSMLHQDKSTPLYDIYCGRKQLVVVSRCGGFHSASFEGRFDNSFQGGVYEWKSGEKTGKQYDCEERDLLQLFRYSTDVGGFMTGLYMQTQTQPEWFQKPIERENDVKEFRLKEPRDNFLAIAVYEDPLWLCELTTLNANREEVKRVYSRPVEVDRIPEEISRELKEVSFEPTKRTIHSLMVYP